MSNGSLMAEVSTGGVYAGNHSSITDGITEYRPAAVTYTATTPLTGITNNKTGADGNTAHWDLDLSAYNASDETMAEDLINKYKGKTFGTNTTAEYEFIDTGSSAGMDGLYKVIQLRLFRHGGMAREEHLVGFQQNFHRAAI